MRPPRASPGCASRFRTEVAYGARDATTRLALLATPEGLLKGARERGEEMTLELAEATVAFAKGGKYSIKVSPRGKRASRDGLQVR